MQSMMWLCFMVVSVLGSATTISDLDQVIVVDDLSDLVHQSAFFYNTKYVLKQNHEFPLDRFHRQMTGTQSIKLELQPTESSDCTSLDVKVSFFSGSRRIFELSRGSRYLKKHDDDNKITLTISQEQLKPSMQIRPTHLNVPEGCDLIVTQV